jgi:hypothetical protein
MFKLDEISYAIGICTNLTSLNLSSTHYTIVGDTLALIAQRHFKLKYLGLRRKIIYNIG